MFARFQRPGWDSWGVDADSPGIRQRRWRSTSYPVRQRPLTSRGSSDLHRPLSTLPESGGRWLRNGAVVIGWALRWVLLCCGIVLISIGILDRGTALLPNRAAEFKSDARLTASTQRPADFSSNTIVYTADNRGHVILDATVNGTLVKMLVDTGATLVTLTPGDARAAGIDPGELQYSGRVSTANGIARMGRVSLREIRIGQLSLYDVPAAVIENLDVSLLGMSFLGRLQGYEMRDGKLTISW
jgi:aspartyl protease family protein